MSPVPNPKCEWCGKPLLSWRDKLTGIVNGYGFDRNGFFCTLKCGLLFAVNVLKRKARP